MEIINGDCLEEMRKMAENSVDSIVTDPPYGLKFMGKKWDVSVPSVDIWKECLRVLKPGGHLLSFAGTRTQHRMACNIEDAGFEIRDMIAWVYGSGFPKSLDVGKAIDKAAGAEREVVSSVFRGNRAGTSAGIMGSAVPRTDTVTAPATPLAQQWSGWGTALKPALEPITVARKPLTGTVASNVLEWGTGAINVDGCRVAAEARAGWSNQDIRGGQFASNPDRPRLAGNDAPGGRWPANLIHDGSDEVVGLFPVTGASKATPRNNGEFKSVAKGRELPHVTHGHDDNGGSAARFFYCAKASKADRDGGCEGMPKKENKFGNQRNGEDLGNGSVNDKFTTQPSRNHHPTVKPTELMRYLCKLVTPPGGVVLDPFMGSGSTGKAAVLEGFDFIGMDLDPAYCEIARARIEAARPAEPLPLPTA